MSPRPTASVRTRPTQFSLWALFVLMTLASVVAAAWAFEKPLGILVYFTCLLLLCTWRRVHLDERFAERQESELYLEHFLRVSYGVLIAGSLAMAAACASLIVGSNVQHYCERLAGMPTLYSLPTPQQVQAMRWIRYGSLCVSIPAATLAALALYYFTFPRATQCER
jgi:hypothetical protein